MHTPSFSSQLKRTSSLCCIALLAACGGGSTSAPASGNPSPPAVVEVAGAAKWRAAAGFDIQVTPYTMSNSAPGALPSRMAVRVSDPTQVMALVASIGTDHDSAASVSAVPGTPGTWNVTVPANVAPGSGLLLTVDLRQGDQYETGLSDFPLK